MDVEAVVCGTKLDTEFPHCCFTFGKSFGVVYIWEVYQNFVGRMLRTKEVLVIQALDVFGKTLAMVAN